MSTGPPLLPHQQSHSQNYQPSQSQNSQPPQTQNYQQQSYQPPPTQNYQPPQNQNYQQSQSQNYQQPQQQSYQPPPVQNYQPSQNYQQQTQSPPTRPPQQNYGSSRQGSFIDVSQQCGMTSQRIPESVSLIINGQPAVKGQFPWLAVYYHNGINNNGFICGGSLVSSNAIITAAHCVQNKNEDSPRRAEEAIFYIGKYYIGSFTDEKDFVFSSVQRFIIHPDWRTQGESYDGDIAIAKLSRTIPFTNSIKPICLWTSTTSYYDIVNRAGVVAGYGKTEFISTNSDKPYWVALPVIDEGTCLRSNSAFTRITSRRTFCVGNRDGKGPCNGMIKNNVILHEND